MLETIETGKKAEEKVVAVVVTGQRVECLLDCLHLINVGYELDDLSQSV